MNVTKQKDYFFKGEKADSALSEHAVDNCSMGIDWENASMLSMEARYLKRCVRESLEIQRKKVGQRKDKIKIERQGSMLLRQRGLICLKNSTNTNLINQGISSLSYH